MAKIICMLLAGFIWGIFGLVMLTLYNPSMLAIGLYFGFYVAGVGGYLILSYKG